MSKFTGTLAMDYSETLLDLANSVIQPKFDGVRVQIVPVRQAANKVDVRMFRPVYTRTCTRSGGYVPNGYVREKLDLLPLGLDGELTVASDSATDEAAFSSAMSSISSKLGELKFVYKVYDYISQDLAHLPYSKRMAEAAKLDLPDFVKLVRGEKLNSAEDLASKVKALVDLGYEGAIVRRTDLAHVPGRSSRKAPAVMRIKA